MGDRKRVRDIILGAELFETLNTRSVGAVGGGAQTLFKIELNESVQVWESQSRLVSSSTELASGGTTTGCGSIAISCRKEGEARSRDSLSAIRLCFPGICSGTSVKLCLASTKNRQRSKCIS